MSPVLGRGRSVVGQLVPPREGAGHHLPAPTQAVLHVRSDEVDLPGGAEVGARAAQAPGIRVAAEDARRLPVPGPRHVEL